MKLLFCSKLLAILLGLAYLLTSSFVQAESQPISATLLSSSNGVEAGKPFTLYVVLDLEKGWHTYGNPPGDSGFPPKVVWELPSGWSVGPLEYSAATTFKEPGDLVIHGYENRAVLRALVTPSSNLSKTSTSSWKIQATISWLACKELCIPGKSIASITLSDGMLPTLEKQSLLKSVSGPSLWPQKETASHDQSSTSWVALLLALGSGLLGGLILNLMPCVLPVISLKIFGFISQAGESREKILRHGLAFTAGIYSWFLTLGLLILFLKSSGKQVTWAFQFQNPAFLLAISVIIFLFALNLFGIFEMTLSHQASSSLDKLAAHEGYRGSFFQGLFATLLATPCTAPFLGSALGFAFAQRGSIIMLMFFSIATGMAFPYLILSAKPGWMTFLPRPGAWMERVKQFMGFPLVATNIWLLYVLAQQRGLEAAIMTVTLLLILSLSAWIYGAFVTSNKSFLAVIITLLIAAVGFWFCVPKILALPKTTVALENSPSDDNIAWIPYSETKLQELRTEGKAVFIDFSAAWCLTCQFNERTAINTAPVRALLKKEKIIPMKADWTNANPEITKALASFGRVGVPFYVFYPAGKDSKPITLSELLTTDQLLNTFSKNNSLQ